MWWRREVEVLRRYSRDLLLEMREPSPPVRNGGLLAKRRPSALSLDVKKVSAEANACRRPIDDVPMRDLEQYSMLKPLGQGTTGVVYEARHQETGERVALKVMRMDDEEMLEIARKEYELLHSVQHPHIIRALDFFRYPKGVVLVLEHFPGSTLDEAIEHSPGGRLEESCAQRLFSALAQAVQHLHQQGIIHRDVKAQNVLVSADFEDLRLVDFNTARQMSDGALTMTGTVDYLPPEVLLGNSLTKEADVWAMGVCLHLMLTGSLPLKRRLFASNEDFGRQLLGGQSSSKVSLESLGLAPGCREVLHACLEVDPQRRPGVGALFEKEWLALPGQGPPQALV